MESAGLEYRVRNHVSPHRYMRGKECAGQKTRLGAIGGYNEQIMSGNKRSL